MYETEANGLRAVLDKHHHALSDELASLFDSRVRAAAESGRTRSAESSNQMLRTIRQAESQLAVLRFIRVAAAAYAANVVVLAVEDNQARTIGEDGARFAFDVETVAAVRAVIQTKDPVVTLPTSAEIGEDLARAVGDAEGKAYLFPITVRQEVTAMLILTGGVAPAPPELLCEAAGLRLEALTAPARSEAGLVQIAQPVIPASETSGPRAWSDLTAEDQKLHLQAQRVARVKVAELRLEHGDSLRRGTFDGDLYGALRPSIDAARAEFLQTFLAKSTTMVDYLHLEIMRSLAHDDDRLLGKEYPGPMV